MVFAVNPTEAQTYEAFKARAMATNTSSSGSPSLPSGSTSAFLKTTSTTIQKITATLAGEIVLIQLLLRLVPTVAVLGALVFLRFFL